MLEKKKSSRRRWVIRVGLGVVILMLIVGAIPFLFTTALTRWALGRSAYAQFRPTIHSASLSLKGRLVVEGLELHELAGGKDVIAAADTVTVTFPWSGVLGSRVSDIFADGAGIFLREEKHEGGVQKNILPSFSVIDLFTPEHSDDAQTPSSAAARPFWFDHLRVRGDIDAYDVAELNVTSLTVPFDFNCMMHGDGMLPSRDFTLSMGDTQNSSLSAKVSEEPKGEGTGIVIQELVGKKLHGAIADAFAAALMGGFPKGMQGGFEFSLDNVELAGVVEPGVKGMAMEGQVTLKGLSVSSEAGAKNAWGVNNFNVGGSFSGPMGTDFLKEGSVKEGKLGFDSLLYGKNEVKAFSSLWELIEGTLNASNIVAQFASGEFTGDASYSLAEGKLGKATLKIAHLDQSQVAANLAPDKLNAEGTVSGTVALSSGERNTVIGTIELVADGPGRLQIKDEQTANALAQKLETGAASGVLPPNFSDIVVGQLKNYPYETGRITVSAQDGMPVITLNYHRGPVTAGEPGFCVKTTMAGQAVTVNYTVQLPEVAIVLKGRTIKELLALSSGVQKTAVGAGSGK